jgi:hypothetical protein
LAGVEVNDEGKEVPTSGSILAQDTAIRDTQLVRWCFKKLGDGPSHLFTLEPAGPEFVLGPGSVGWELQFVDVVSNQWDAEGLIVIPLEETSVFLIGQDDVVVDGGVIVVHVVVVGWECVVAVLRLHLMVERAPTWRLLGQGWWAGDCWLGVGGENRWGHVFVLVIIIILDGLVTP